MKTPSLAAVVRWLVVPALLATAAAAVGQWRALTQRGQFYEATQGLPPRAQQALESAPALAAANLTWSLGSLDSVQKMLRFELDRLPEWDGKNRARALVRFGIVDRNPEGQAAIFSQACNAEPSLCDGMKEAASRELEQRLVTSANQLPLYFLPNHPPIQGP